LAKNRDYFIDHAAFNLPDEFVSRIGELDRCTFTDDVMVAFHKVNTLISEAEEYVWILSSQILMSTLPLLEEAVKRGTKFRLILPVALVPPPGFKPVPVIPNLIERRTLQKVDVVVVLSEKEARVAFPTNDGKMDHIGFGSTEKAAYLWCKDLFLHYWEKAQLGKPTGYPSS
jgi:predicted transcriptional regulator